MSKVLLKRRLPWPSGLILAGAPQHLLRLPPCPEFPVWQVAGGGTGQVSGAITRSVGGVGESDRTMDILVRRGLPLRSWQAEESRTRMSKV
ncbi:MAG: hypothetical protein WCO86_15000, partial [Planctomycetota bacterium]